MVKGKSWKLIKHFDGMPNSSNFKLVEEDVPESLNEGDILCEAIYLSVDPYMRIFSSQMLKEGDEMFGDQIARVTASKNSKFPVGTNITGMIGWRTHTLIHEDKFVDLTVIKLPPFGELPVSLGLGTLGDPGWWCTFFMTPVIIFQNDCLLRIIGLLELCHPKEGDVVLVNAAAGAVGSVVGQIAKIKGCKVIAFAGTKEKCDWLKNDLDFDHVFNYKEIDVGEAIDKASPDGIDVYFDNVGGELFTTAAFPRLKNNGRMAVCGSISDYNNASPAPDVDECAIDNGGCLGTCQNTVGSFTCGCPAGTTLNGDGRTCDDVDECATSNGGCAGTCQNTVGTFTCGCPAGTTLNGDGRTCDDVDECATSNGGCAGTCQNTSGTFTCGCPTGTTLNGDGRTCDDNNECQTANGGCEDVCANIPGSFTCSCASRLPINPDGRSCPPFDFMVDCDFSSGLCSWVDSVTVLDDFDWTRLSGSTPSTSTGPSGDHTTANGHYIYMETTNTGLNDKALLVSPSIDGTITQCLTFYYHMFGVNINTLNLYAAVGNTFGAPIFTTIGPKGDIWEKIQVQLTGTMTNSPTNFVFEGIAGSSYEGDIALDDISHFAGPCLT